MNRKLPAEVVFILCVATILACLPLVDPLFKQVIADGGVSEGGIHRAYVAVLAGALGLGLGSWWVFRRGLYKIGNALATRRRRLRLLKALPPARTRREKIEELKAEVEAAEQAERERLDTEGRKIEAEEKTVQLVPGGTATLQGGSGATSGAGGNVTITGGSGVGAAWIPFPTSADYSETKLGRNGILFDTPEVTTLPAEMPQSILGSMRWLWARVATLESDVSNLDKRFPASQPTTAPRKESLYDTDLPPMTAERVNRGGGIQLVPLPSSGAVIAGRARKEPVWERRVFETGDHVRFFDGMSVNQDGSLIQKNTYGSHGGMPQAHHLFWSALAVRFDEEPPADWLACTTISFEFVTSRLLTLPLGTVYDAGIDGRDVMISGRPVEINALESFTVRIETTGYTGPRMKVGLTVSLNGILLKGIAG